jgi:predicted nucleic acid-binding protein
VIVVDASILAVALGNDGAQGATARRRLRGEVLSAPELIDLEVLSVLRRNVASGLMTVQRGGQAMGDLIELPLQRASHRPLLRRCWELRHNLTSDDASYVALAEALEVPLLTADARLVHAPGTQCTVELFQ